MVLLPAHYKPLELQIDPAHHAALVVSKNPVGPGTPLLPQPDGEFFLEAENIPTLQTLVYDAHSRRRSLILDNNIAKQWEWKANTSLGYHVKIVHQDYLHAVIVPNNPTYGLRLSDESFQQVLRDLEEEHEGMEHARLAYLASGLEKRRHCVM